jgi:hypothetical protein
LPKKKGYDFWKSTMLKLSLLFNNPNGLFIETGDLGWGNWPPASYIAGCPCLLPKDATLAASSIDGLKKTANAGISDQPGHKIRPS